MFFPNRVQFLSTYHRQLFALPDPIMEYIAKNPQFAEHYQKMIKSCKYFFIKNPILVIHDLRYNSGNGWEMRSPISGGWKKVDMKKLSCKLWITDYLRVNATTSDKNVLLSIIPKIDKCQAERLDIFKQEIVYEELDILGKFAKYVWFEDSVVKYQNGKNVELEKIVQIFPEAIEIVFPFDSIISAKTVKELLKLPNFSKLDAFRIFNIPEDFDIESFFAYIKTNKQTIIRLEFAETISEAYKARLNAVFDEIVETEGYDYKLPWIYYPGIDVEKEEFLFARFLDFQ
uniref:DUF38 domain-containing protein n=1 Tax=Panagrolaimus davidi TaxID=227884 RepID=A0A914PGR7_9BILA